MVTINCAYTEPINPPGETPVLSREQVWKALHRKVRAGQDFVPVIASTDVLEDKGDEVTRVAKFKPFQGRAAGHEVKEVCKLYPMTKVDFYQPSGAVITNTVSDGPGLTENDYNMTYTFEWRDVDVEEGSKEHMQKIEQYIGEAKKAVHSTIVEMRKMAARGEL